MSEALIRKDSGLSPVPDAETADRLILAIGRLEARLSAIENNEKVTVLHRDALALNRCIRDRAGEIAGKYGLTAEGEKRIRAAIKRDVLRQYGIPDLHDLPEKRLAACRMLISSWSSYQRIKEAAKWT